MTELSQKGKRYYYDALVIGSGLAGISFCLALIKRNPATRIALVTKSSLAESNSRYAQGGIAAVSQPDDSIEKHIADTLAAGDGACFYTSVHDIISLSTEAIDELIALGVPFVTEGDVYSLAREGGHSERRIFHCNDQTGKNILDTLLNYIKNLPQIDIYEHHYAINLISNNVHIPGKLAEILGAYVLSASENLIHTFLAKVTVLATGGAGKVYRYTTNPDIATGDGIAMACRAGARVANMEFYQFHPTLLYHTKQTNFLISEAIRGEGAYLRSPDSGERFMKYYAPKNMELATRDVIARAIFTEIERSTCNYVYLDARHIDENYLQNRFPYIYRTLQNLDINMGKELIPVVPAAHYLCGGVLADITGKTDLPRLFAIGETAFTGLHGANRLASNSLLETVVMGKQAAAASQIWLNAVFDYTVKDWDSKCVVDLRRASQINTHWRGLRGEMTSYAGLIRTAAGLRDLLRLIRTRREMVEDYYWQYSITPDLIELRNIILIAELITRGALLRIESRGCHFREDYPEKLSEFKEIILSYNEIL